MKRFIVLSFIALFLFCGSRLWSVNKKQMEKWVGIITEKDPAVKFQKLEDFRAEYGEDKQSQLTPLMYQHLSEASFLLKKYDKTIEYGEMTLTFPDVDENQKLFILFRLANAYFIQNNLEKSLEYGQKVIDKANALKVPANAQLMDTDFIAPAMRLQAKVTNNLRPNDPQGLKSAALKAMEAMKIDKSKESDTLVRTLANMLIKQNNEADAIAILEELYLIKPDADLAKLLGKYFSTKVIDDEKAMDYFRASYELKKTAEIAYYLGILQNKKYRTSNDLNDLGIAVNYFAEAFIFNDFNISPKADKYLQQLYFNELKKDATAEEKEKGFQETLEAAKVRLGLSTTELTTSQETPTQSQ